MRRTESLSIRPSVLAMNAGMDSGILDSKNQDLVGMIFATEALLGQDEYCMEYIGVFREGRFVQKKSIIHLMI